MPHRMNSTQGFSLLELMIAAALGVVMTTAILQVFATNSSAQRLLQGQARLQESARHAMYFLAHSARVTGYLGCETGDGAMTGQPPKATIQEPVAGFDGIGKSLGKLKLSNTQPGSDVVVFRRIVKSAKEELSIAGESCASPKVAHEIYFVGRTTGTNNDRGEPIWSLRRKRGKSAQQLVSGIEDLQVLYGIDTTPGDGSGPEQYVTADQVGGNAVLAIHVTVTASSVDAATADGPISRAFSQTIAVRNP